MLRRLRFFHDFSHAEIREVMRAGAWLDCAPGEPILRPGDIDDRFYVVVSGRVQVSRDGDDGRPRRARAAASARPPSPKARAAISAITADGPVTLLKVTATLLEQTSIACQLRFNKVFLRELIERLQRGRKSE